MKIEDRITAIDILITAAQVRLQDGDAFTSMQLLQDARIIAVMNDKFLKQQEKHVNDALAMAHNVIEKYQKEIQGNANRQGTNDN